MPLDGKFRVIRMKNMSFGRHELFCFSIANPDTPVQNTEGAIIRTGWCDGIFHRTYFSSRAFAGVTILERREIQSAAISLPYSERAHDKWQKIPHGDALGAQGCTSPKQGYIGLYELVVMKDLQNVVLISFLWSGSFSKFQIRAARIL